MSIKMEALRKVLYSKRVAEARAWSDSERAQAAAHNDAVRRILDQPGARTVPYQGAAASRDRSGPPQYALDRRP